MDPGRPSDEDILKAISDEESPVLGTSELARIFDYSPAGMAKRLSNLNQYLVSSRDCGGVRIWWLTEKGEKYLEGDLEASQLEEAGES